MKFLKQLALKIGIKKANTYINEYFGMKKKKKFGQTVVGKLLGHGLGLINPALGGLVGTGAGVGDVLTAIKDSQIPAEDKHRAQELVIQAYEAEVSDRIAARNREASVLLAGGSDIMFKIVGAGVMVIWGSLIWALFIGKLEVSEDTADLMNIAFGAVSAQMMAIVSYYFGASMQPRK